MIKKATTGLSLLAAVAFTVAGASSVNAQTNYFQTPAYQAEEQAFRARQDEGSRLYEAFGPHSPQYRAWQMRENALKGVQSSPWLYNNPYQYQYHPYPNSYMYGYPWY